MSSLPHRHRMRLFSSSDGMYSNDLPSSWGIAMVTLTTPDFGSTEICLTAGAVAANPGSAGLAGGALLLAEVGPATVGPGSRGDRARPAFPGWGGLANRRGQ